jgi:hypothetical protein
MSWFAGLSLVRKLGLGAIAILLLIACVAIANHWTDSAFNKAEEKGASDARADSAEEGLKHVEEGNKAAEGVARDAGLRKSGCVRHSRTPENC